MTDPYAIYARLILRLRAVPAIRHSDDYQLRGLVFHDIVETFVGQDWQHNSHETHVARFLSVSERVLAARVPWPTDQRLWLARLRCIADEFVAGEMSRQSGAKTILAERSGTYDMGDDLALVARPDRIDLIDGTTLRIIDYKSGALPKEGEIGKTEFQLPLEAAMASAGSFPGVPALPSRQGQYIRLGGKGEVLDVDFGQHVPSHVLVKVRDLLFDYAGDRRAFIPRKRPMGTDRATDYDGISRYGEWAPGDPPHRERVGN